MFFVANFHPEIRGELEKAGLKVPTLEEIYGTNNGAPKLP